MSGYPYNKVLTSIDATLRREAGDQDFRFERALKRARRTHRRRLSDDQVFEKLVLIPFYSGFRASTVTSKKPAILERFPDYQTVARYPESKVRKLSQLKSIIANKSKIRAAVENARAMKTLVAEHGSFQGYLKRFGDLSGFESLMVLTEDLQSRFSYLGPITVYHLMMELGLGVLKPDRAVCRVMHRLGLIGEPNHLISAIAQGRLFAKATGEPIRAIDYLLVRYGQQGGEDGIKKGICLEKHPRCEVCGLRRWCREARI